MTNATSKKDYKLEMPTDKTPETVLREDRWRERMRIRDHGDRDSIQMQGEIYRSCVLVRARLAACDQSGNPMTTTKYPEVYAMALEECRATDF